MSTTTAAPSGEQMYIDYSCSTSVERLARDVETILRKWHVAAGSDRHVAFSTNSRPGSTACSRVASRAASRQSSRIGAGGVGGGGGVSGRSDQQQPKAKDDGAAASPSKKGGGGKLFGVFPIGKNKKNNDDNDAMQKTAPSDDVMDIDTLDDVWIPLNDDEQNDIDENTDDEGNNTAAVRLIRSADVTLASFPLPAPLYEDHHDMIMSGTSSGTNRTDVELTLALWDGPPRSTGDGIDVDDSKGGNNNDIPPLPLSLLPRYDAGGGIMPPCITSDLSALLGIGQHITLTPRVFNSNAQEEDSPAAMLLESTILARTKARPKDGQVAADNRSKAKKRRDKKKKDKDNKSPEIIMDELHGTATLSSLLQAALNFAASACDCRIPAFGLWGPYDPQRWWQDDKEECGDDNCGEFNIPYWLAGGWATVGQGYISGELGMMKRKRPLALKGVSLPSIPASLPTHQIPPTLAGRCHSGPTPGSACGNFSVYAIPPDLDGAEHLSTLDGLGRLLLQSIPRRDDSSLSSLNSVCVSGARHCYRWDRESDSSGDKKRKWSSDDEETVSWRISGFGKNRKEPALDDDKAAVMQYRKKCESHVVRLLERAAALGQVDKQRQRRRRNDGESHHQSLYPLLWGPDIDPTLVIAATAAWNVTTNQCTQIKGIDTIDTDMEIVERDTTTDPLLTLPLKTRSSHRPSLADINEIESTLFSTIFDPRNVLSDAFHVGVKFDTDAPCTNLSASNRCVLAGLIKVSNLDDETLVGHLTQKVVLDELHAWETELDNANRNPARVLMDRAGVGDTTRQLFDVMDWKSMANAKRIYEDDIERALGVALGGGSVMDGGIPFPSPPVGVFKGNDGTNGATRGCAMDLSALGSAPPGRFLSVFFTSIASLRTPSSMAAAWLALVDEVRSRWDLRESLPNLGFVPGLDGANEEYNRRRIAAEEKGDRRHKFISPPIGRQLGSRALCAAFVNSSEPEPNLHNCLIAQKLQIFNICVECIIAAETEPADLDFTDSPSDDFYDAVDDNKISLTATDVSPDSSLRKERLSGRKGVRCPVHGVFLTKTGDQLYAPYLRRTEPISRDELVQRRAVLAEATTPKCGKYTIQERLEVAHRLQKPKLLSDMRSFKAANPGACFQDFTAWYGNPDNPLDEYKEGERNAVPTRVVYPPATSSPLDNKQNLEKASEAIHVLTAIRNFWYETFEKAKPCPASEQDPLFDPEVASAVAMHALETIHPAYLMNQILAVNLSSAVFVLHSEAGDIASQVPAVNTMLKKLGDVTEAALLNLAEDRAGGWIAKRRSARDIKDGGRYVSTDTIASCEMACNAIGEVEIILSRAMSLLSKFPRKYSLVQDILACKEGKMVSVDGHEARTEVIDMILKQQNQLSIASEHIPSPSMQEYIIRNRDDQVPCQLTVRLGNGSLSKGGLIVALSKCDRA